MQVHEYLKSQVRRLVVKSKTAQKNAVELNLEVRLKDDNTDFINTLAQMEGVNSAVLVSYNDDYMDNGTADNKEVSLMSQANIVDNPYPLWRPMATTATALR